MWYPVKAVLESAKHGLPSQSWGNIIQLPPCDPRHTTNPVVHSSVAREKARHTMSFSRMHIQSHAHYADPHLAMSDSVTCTFTGSDLGTVVILDSAGPCAKIVLSPENIQLLVGLHWQRGNIIEYSQLYFLSIHLHTCTHASCLWLQWVNSVTYTSGKVFKKIQQEDNALLS